MFGLLLVLPLSCVGETEPQPVATSVALPAFTLVYSGAVGGEIEPCG